MCQTDFDRDILGNVPQSLKREVKISTLTCSIRAAPAYGSCVWDIPASMRLKHIPFHQPNESTLTDLKKPFRFERGRQKERERRFRRKMGGPDRACHHRFFPTSISAECIPSFYCKQKQEVDVGMKIFLPLSFSFSSL